MSRYTGPRLKVLRALGVDLPGLGYRVAETVATDLATHIVLTR